MFGCFATGLYAQEGFTVRDIKFAGNDSIPDEFLLSQMNTKPGTLKEKLIFWKRNNSFASFTFESDLIRLHKFYQRNGFPDSEITSEYILDNKRKKLDITINIMEGLPVIVDSVIYDYYGSSDASGILDTLKKELPLQSGIRFRDEKIFLTEESIRNNYFNRGYPYIELDKEIIYNGQNPKAKVNFRINPGKKSYLGEIIVEGDSLVTKKYISNHIEINRDRTFSPVTLNKIQNDLFRLGLFRFVTVRALTDSVRKDSIPVLIKVMELPRWSFKMGAGYGTEDRIRLSLLMTRLNFLGGGRSLIVKVQHSYFTPFAAEGKLIQPDLIMKNLDFIVNPYFSKEREESYTVQRRGSAFTFQKKIKHSSAYISYSYGKDIVNLSDSYQPDMDQENPDEKDNFKSGITLGFNRNSTNDLFSPTRGWKINSTATVMGLGNRSLHHYYRITGDISWLMPLGKSVIAYKIKGGVIQPVKGADSTPIEDRFLLGGAMSLRGWGRHQISPVNINGDKIGGNSMTEAGIEWRFPIVGIFSGAVFSDFGNTWENPWEVKFNDLLFNAGSGIRVNTPVGPVRLDLATPLFAGKLKTQFFITIGHAF